MSIADHFERAPDASFIRNYEPGTARRQLSMSFVLMLLVAFAAASLTFVVRFDAPSASSNSPALETSAPPAYAGRL